MRDVKTYPGADCGTDHQLLVAEFRLKLKRPPPQTLQRNRWHLLNNEKYRERAQRSLKTITNIYRDNLDANGLWERLKKELNSATKETDMRDPRLDRRKPWISDATWEIIKKKKYIKAQGLTRANNETYNEYGELIKKECRRDKEHYLNNICKEIERHSNRNEAKDLFRKIRLITREFRPKTLTVDNENGQPVTTFEDILQRWKQYYEDLMSGETNV